MGDFLFLLLFSLRNDFPSLSAVPVCGIADSIVSEHYVMLRYAVLCSAGRLPWEPGLHQAAPFLLETQPCVLRSS